MWLASVDMFGGGRVGRVLEPEVMDSVEEALAYDELERHVLRSKSAKFQSC